MEYPNNDSNDVEASGLSGYYMPPQPDYDPLTLTVMSALLEHDGEVSANVLYEQMKDNGIKRNRVTACIRNTLLRSEMIWAENGVIFVLKGGMDYVIANAHRLDEAEEGAGRTKKDIAEEAARQRAAETGTPLPNQLILTAQAMNEEMNHMRQALGEPPEYLGDIASRDEASLSKLVSTLSSEMKKLEKRLNDQPKSRRPAGSLS